MDAVWVFNSEQSHLPGATFTTRALAEAWITRHSLSGLLTKYPLDVGVYEWSIANGYFRPTKDYQHDGQFIGRFSSASLEHYHYEAGVVNVNDPIREKDDETTP